MINSLKTLILALSFCVCTMGFAAVQDPAINKIALLIGNADYSDITTLDNPVNDTHLMAASLTELGFTVSVATDASRREMREALRDFSRKLEEGSKNADTWALFYFAGHAIEVDGQNFLLPVDADIQERFEVEDQALKFNSVLASIEASGSHSNIIVLDACRDNPFAEKTRSIVKTRGLAPVSRSIGESLVIYATAPGDVAEDGEGNNSVFSAALAELLMTPAASLNEVVMKVRRTVKVATAGRQVPWSETNFTQPIYMHSRPVPIQPVAADDLQKMQSQINESLGPVLPGLSMILVNAGTARIGSSTDAALASEKPVRSVAVNAFFMSDTEVTFDHWDACVSAGGCSHKPDDENTGRGKRPVSNVSWRDIHDQFLPWLYKATGLQFRLPSEAEWEYAARAGSNNLYSWGDAIDCQQARFGQHAQLGGHCGNERSSTPVRGFSANAFGLYDMHGNVYEWVQDCVNANYQNAPAGAAAWLSGDCSSRIVRGGSWAAPPLAMRAAYRKSADASQRYSDFGFRLALDAKNHPDR